ncbi:hypothetical protein FCL40_05885 [Ferrimonas sediminicola]|uniref:EamA domain-containing protein n=1 Tax=Ferrimonas sediminicola TaxID=2569538 RepID=A0A4U1BG51_9GAMM|nr:DMT family transporter [Ferrimonas sediminicola]TKB49692.1 hypothetical protein FCL40_05885 [Ferrimonas sediminicola]
MYTSLKNLLLTALAPIIWGSTYIITSEVLPDNMPLTAAAARALPAGILLLALFGKLPSGGWWTRLMLLGVLNIGGFFYFLFLTAYLLPGGIAALVMSCQPLIVMALGTQLLGTTYDRNQLLATVIGMVGITLLLIHSTIELNTLGVLAGLTGTSVMALGVVLTKKWGRPDGMVNSPHFHRHPKALQ